MKRVPPCVAEDRHVRSVKADLENVDVEPDE